MLAIENHLGQLKKLCDMHCVDKMYLFGSALGPEFSEHSDIDFLVEFKTIDLAHYFENYLSFKTSLQDLLGRKVDLLEAQTLKKPHIEKID